MKDKIKIAIDAMKFFKEKLHNGIYGEFVGNFDTAISALEKQMPKKVNISLKGTTGWNTKCHCPNCRAFISNGKYCYECGQALDFGSDTIPIRELTAIIEQYNKQHGTCYTYGQFVSLVHSKKIEL